MEPFLGKKYVLVKSENDDDYYKFLGINIIKRKLAQTMKPVSCLKKNDDGTYTLEMSSTVVNTTNVFTPGVEFDETKADGGKCRSIITFEGNKMIYIQKEENGMVSKHVREYFPDKLVAVTTAEGFDKAMIRTYELVK